jgi:hypothetical protein
MVYDAKIYLGVPKDVADQKHMDKDFNEWWNDPLKHGGNHPHPTLDVYAAKDFNVYAKSFSEELTLDDIGKIDDTKTLTFYVFSRVQYSDRNGQWQSDKCMYAEDISVNPNAYHKCDVNNVIRSRIK